jgi:hypothetical protein
MDKLDNINSITLRDNGYFEVSNEQGKGMIIDIRSIEYDRKQEKVTLVTTDPMTINIEMFLKNMEKQFSTFDELLEYCYTNGLSPKSHVEIVRIFKDALQKNPA